MAIKTYYYSPSPSLSYVKMRLNGGPSLDIGNASSPIFIPVSADDTQKVDLDQAMASIGWIFENEADGSVVEMGTADSPIAFGYTPLLAIDASGGDVEIDLPDLSTVLNKGPFWITKVDSSANKVQIKPNGAQTFNGQQVFELVSNNDSVLFYKGPIEWRVLAYQDGGEIVAEDLIEIEVLDRSAADFVLDTSSVPAADAAAQCSKLETAGVDDIDLVVDLTANPGATALRVLLRFSGKADPDVAVPSDWAEQRRNDGQSSDAVDATVTKPYTAEIPLSPGQTGRFLVSLERRQTWVSALVWVSGGTEVGTRGRVYAQRRKS